MTITLEGHSTQILNQFYLNYSPSSPDFDTLIDLNFDKKLDYIICYYGIAGNGIKNRILVYIVSDNNSYVYDSTLSDIVNPTFYLNNKKITGFYVGNGGGSGSKLQWINDKWITTKEFSVDINF